MSDRVIIFDDLSGRRAIEVNKDVVGYHARVVTSLTTSMPDAQVTVEDRSAWGAVNNPRGVYTSWLVQHWLPWAFGTEGGE